MNTEQRLMICQYCENRSMDIDTEMVCGLSIKNLTLIQNVNFTSPIKIPCEKI
jgi:hypothetical protein